MLILNGYKFLYAIDLMLILMIINFYMYTRYRFNAYLE